MEHVPKSPPKMLLDLERFRGRVDEEPCSRSKRASRPSRIPVPESPSPLNLTTTLRLGEDTRCCAALLCGTGAGVLLPSTRCSQWVLVATRPATPSSPHPLPNSPHPLPTHLYTSTAALSYRGHAISVRTGLVPELSRPCCERALSGGPPMAMDVSAWAILPRLRCSLHGAALRYLVGTIAAVLGPGRRLQTAAPWYRKRLERDGGVAL